MSRMLKLVPSHLVLLLLLCACTAPSKTDPGWNNYPHGNTVVWDGARYYLADGDALTVLDAAGAPLRKYHPALEEGPIAELGLMGRSLILRDGSNGKLYRYEPATDETVLLEVRRTAAFYCTEDAVYYTISSTRDDLWRWQDGVAERLLNDLTPGSLVPDSAVCWFLRQDGLPCRYAEGQTTVLSQQPADALAAGEGLCFALRGNAVTRADAPETVLLSGVIRLWTYSGGVLYYATETESLVAWDGGTPQALPAPKACAGVQVCHGLVRCLDAESRAWVTTSLEESKE